MSHRPGRPRVLGLLMIVALLTGTATPSLRAQEATPATATGAGVQSSITRQEFEEQIRGSFELEEPAAQGGTVILGGASDIATVNGLLASDNPTLYVTRLLFEPLVVSSPIDGQPAPGLAEWWERAPDGVTYTFHLNEQATWHDGADVTAADVVYSLDAQLSPDTGSSYTSTVASVVASYRVVDEDTVEVVSNGPIATFLLDLYLPVMPRHIWEDIPFDQWATDPGSTGQDPARVVGSGPFAFQEWVQGDHVTLRRNPDYHGTAPAIDAFILQILPNEAAAVQALEAGEIDIMAAVPPAEVDRLSATDDLDVAVYDTFNFDFYLYNLDPERTELFQDVRVRHALYVALDRTAIDEGIYFGLGEPAAGPHPPLSIAYAPEQMRTDYDYDPEAARALLAEAGWTDTNGDGVVDQNGEEFAFELITFTGSPTVQQTAAYMQDAWTTIGVEMTPVLVEFPTLIETITVTHDFEMAMLGFSWDATANQGAMFTCGAYEGGFNVMKYCNPRYDELNERQRHELDHARRVDLLIEMANIVWDDLPVGIIQFLKGHTGYATRLHNFHPNGFSLIWSLPYVWVEE